MTDPIWTLMVLGSPQPKGSLKCVGRASRDGGRGSHQLVEDDKTGARRQWRAAVTAAGRQLAARIGRPLDRGVGIVAVLTLPRPAAAKKRTLPITRSGGDVDKLARMILDALDDAGVYADDSRVVSLYAGKVYEDQARPPGLWCAVWEMAPGCTQRALTAALARFPELG